MPVPSGSVDVMTCESDSQACHIIEPEPLGKELISPRALSGDPILVEKTLEMIPDLAVQKQYVQELVGEKQINPKEFVCVLEQGRVEASVSDKAMSLKIWLRFLEAHG